jgi:hypothetical protein
MIFITLSESMINRQIILNNIVSTNNFFKFLDIFTKKINHFKNAFQNKKTLVCQNSLNKVYT